METYMFILLILSSVMTLAPAGAWAGQIAVLISLADLVMLQYPDGAQGADRIGPGCLNAATAPLLPKNASQ